VSRREEGATPAFEALKLQRDGDVLVVTIDHPRSELNAVDDLLHGELAKLFSYLRDGCDARAVLLTARGKAFSAGGDFAWFPTLRTPERLESLRHDARSMIYDLLDVEIPIVAAVTGPAVGLAASIVLFCDVVFMSEDAVLADPHVKVGLVAGDGGAVIWPLVLGPARAKRYLLTGDPVRASEALDLGLVSFVAPAASVERDAKAFAARLAAGAPLAIRYTKMAVNKLVKSALETAFDVSTAWELSTFLSEDHEEALLALREKRPPRFKGR
jgi:enoyl-CoA hydratase